MVLSSVLNPLKIANSVLLTLEKGHLVAGLVLRYRFETADYVAGILNALVNRESPPFSKLVL